MQDRGKRIRTAREAAGLTQKQVADHFGIVISTVCRWESGDIDAGTDRIAELAKLFATSPAYLAFGTGASAGTSRSPAPAR